MSDTADATMHMAHVHTEKAEESAVEREKGLLARAQAPSVAFHELFQKSRSLSPCLSPTRLVQPILILSLFLPLSSSLVSPCFLLVFLFFLRVEFPCGLLS